jgi:glycerate kinase
VTPAPILVAPDSFKGTLSATEVAAAVAAGLRTAGRETVELPVADGGEGTMEVLQTVIGGERRTVSVGDPLGRPVDASFLLLPDGKTALVESAQATGLALLAEDERDAFAASSEGTGELIVAAAAAGADTVLLSVGGTANMDGGAGAVRALNEAGVSPKLEVLCDTQTPIEDAPRVFGPQKGADPETVERLEKRMDSLAANAPRDPRGVPMTGAAGGLSGGLWAHHGAELQPGAPYVLNAIGFDDAMLASAFVVTGEGRLDEQTLSGKIVGEVATRCRQRGVTCHVICGKDALSLFDHRLLDLASVTEAGTPEELERAAATLI